MATSVFFSVPTSGQSNRILRIGGTIVNSNWAENADIYTVPAGKRMVLKGMFLLAEGEFEGGIHRVIFKKNPNPVEGTVVLPPGSIIRYNTGTLGFVVSGFIEDDV